MSVAKVKMFSLIITLTFSPIMMIDHDAFTALCPNTPVMLPFPYVFDFTHSALVRI